MFTCGRMTASNVPCLTQRRTVVLSTRKMSATSDTVNSSLIPNSLLISQKNVPKRLTSSGLTLLFCHYFLLISLNYYCIVNRSFHCYRNSLGLISLVVSLRNTFRFRIWGSKLSDSC